MSLRANIETLFTQAGQDNVVAKGNQRQTAALVEKKKVDLILLALVLYSGL